MKKEPGTAESVGTANSSKSGKSLGNKTDKTALGVQLRMILRAHFSECDATELYTELSNAVQHSSESVQNFVVRLMDMRQKVIFASQESESQLQYDPVLVQKLFLRAISTGLISYSIKADIDPYLNDINVSDEVLLEKLNLAANNEAERKHKLGKQARVNVFETPEVEQPNKPRKSERRTQF